jgi:hypothetical protein
MAPPGIEPGLTQNRTPQCVVIPLDHGTRGCVNCADFDYRSLRGKDGQNDEANHSRRVKKSMGKGEETLLLLELTEREDSIHDSVHTYVEFPPGASICIHSFFSLASLRRFIYRFFLSSAPSEPAGTRRRTIGQYKGNLVTDVIWIAHFDLAKPGSRAWRKGGWDQDISRWKW